MSHFLRHYYYRDKKKSAAKRKGQVNWSNIIWLHHWYMAFRTHICITDGENGLVVDCQYWMLVTIEVKMKYFHSLFELFDAIQMKTQSLICVLIIEKITYACVLIYFHKYCNTRSTLHSTIVWFRVILHSKHRSKFIDSKKIQKSKSQINTYLNAIHECYLNLFIAPTYRSQWFVYVRRKLSKFHYRILCYVRLSNANTFQLLVVCK